MRDTINQGEIKSREAKHMIGDEMNLPASHGEALASQTVPHAIARNPSICLTINAQSNQSDERCHSGISRRIFNSDITFRCFPYPHV